jgi:hypothetical protein
LDRIALFLSLSEIHDAGDFELAVKGHLIAALDIAETNKLLFPAIATAVRTNQYYIAAKAWRLANNSTNKYIARVALKSPLWHSEAEIIRSKSSVPASFVHDFEATFVLDEDMANLDSYLALVRRTGKDSFRDSREVAILLAVELENVDSYIDMPPACARMIRNNKSYIAAKEWRKHVRINYE